ncbi:IS1-like element transposase [Xenorhabdus sp. SGI240]|uniref:IS1-like element transposase n=1 Tax=Xenorhabdus sp. SGI240 TaxID=3158262 RepID=UPI0032B83340
MMNSPLFVMDERWLKLMWFVGTVTKLRDTARVLNVGINTVIRTRKNALPET